MNNMLYYWQGYECKAFLKFQKDMQLHWNTFCGQQNVPPAVTTQNKHNLSQVKTTQAQSIN